MARSNQVIEVTEKNSMRDANRRALMDMLCDENSGYCMGGIVRVVFDRKGVGCRFEPIQAGVEYGPLSEWEPVWIDPEMFDFDKMVEDGLLKRFHSLEKSHRVRIYAPSTQFMQDRVV